MHIPAEQFQTPKAINLPLSLGHTSAQVHTLTNTHTLNEFVLYKRSLNALARASGSVFHAGADIPTSEIQ